MQRLHVNKKEVHNVESLVSFEVVTKAISFESSGLALVSSSELCVEELNFFFRRVHLHQPLRHCFTTKLKMLFFHALTYFTRRQTTFLINLFKKRYLL